MKENLFLAIKSEIFLTLEALLTTEMIANDRTSSIWDTEGKFRHLGHSPVDKTPSPVGRG